MIFIKRFFVLLLLILTSGLMQGQTPAQPARVSVVDAATGEPLPFANVCFESLDKTFLRYMITDDKGEAGCVIPSKTTVAVSFVGYRTCYDTLSPGRSIRIKMEPSTTIIEEVVVTAQFTPQRADKSIYPVKVINSKQIEMKAISNLGDLLKGEVSVRTSQDGVLGSSISLQGLSGENVKFLVDGIPVVGRMNGNIDLGQLNLNNADHIEIIEGPMSVVYGSNALAGVVNIITRENHYDKLMVRANSYFESVGVVNADGAFSFKRGRHLLSFSGGRNFFGGFSDPDTSRAKQWKPKRQVFADGSWLYSAPALKIKTGIQFFDEKLLNKGNLIGPYFETAFDNEFYTRRLVARADASWQPADNHSLSLLAAWSGYDRRKETWYNDLTTLNRNLTTNTEDQDTTTFGNITTRGQWSRHSDDSRLNWQTGFDINIEPGSGKRIDNHNQQIGDYAAFVSLLLRPHPVFEIQPGLRAAYNSRYNAPLVYSLNLKWNAGDNLTLRASAAKGFRAPALKELYLYFVDVNHNIRGNTDLKAENSENFNLAVQFERNHTGYQVTAGLSLFYNHVHNIITLAEQEQQLYTYVNVDDYRSQGAQLQSTVRLYPRLVVTAGIGVTGRSSSVTENRVSWTTDLSSEITYQWLHSHVQLTAWYKYTGRLPQFTTGTDGSLTETYTAAYHMLDLSLSKGFFGNKLIAGAGARNLFDVTSIVSGGSTDGVHSGGGSTMPIAWGRTWFVKLSYQFSKKD